MDKLFERNILALAERNKEAAERLSLPEEGPKCYQFLESRNGELIPAMMDLSGAAHPLHSMMDPRKEAKRLIDSVEEPCFLVLLGLGGAYYAEAALERDDIHMVLIIEYGSAGLKELFGRLDYSGVLTNPRCRVLLDAQGEEIERNILDLYQPSLSGGIRVIPLRSRTGFDQKPFANGGEAIEKAVKKVLADYSVQAHFGRRWLANISRNLSMIANAETALPKPRRVAITAAGPSLSTQINQLKEKRKELYLIASDTSLPCLLHENIKPDAVISIDCQHYSYYHFLSGIPEDVLLFLDLASPPLLSRLSKNPRFFISAHPLARYISNTLKTMDELDTSGGNVTYAALSLAELLGAREIELYGADFSYPGGVPYARGTYIYPYFEKSQGRFSPLESQVSAFLYRTPLEKKKLPDNSFYYETPILKFYREKLEEKSSMMEAALTQIRGQGAPVNLKQREIQQSTYQKASTDDKANMKAEDFLAQYRDKIAKLPKAGINSTDYLTSLNSEERILFTTLLPLLAYIKKRNEKLDFGELVEELKTTLTKEINIT